MTGEQRSLSAMPPKYELRWLAVPSAPTQASEPLTLADLSPKHAHCAVRAYDQQATGSCQWR